ncbi:hypothetical protein GQ457_01G007490 [Hibiscus cannabinus]
MTFNGEMRPIEYIFQPHWLKFGLNALFGRNESRTEKGVWIGDWQPQNTRDFVKYIISKGYKVDSYEFGARVDANQYGKDVIVLKNLVKELYADPETRPKVLGPGCFYDEKWFNTFLEVSGRGVVDGVTHHIYNLGPGDDPNLMSKILDPLYLSQVSQTYKGVLNVVNKFRPQSGAWVSESGGAFNSGSKDVSPTFVDGFWYLDQMGMAATYDQKVFCRQALIGGNYGLLMHFYGTDLWGVLCLPLLKNLIQICVYMLTARRKSFINLSKDRSFNITLSNLKSEDDGKPNYEFVGKQNREEYHLTSLFGKMKCGIVCLNDVPMVQPGSRDIPAMDPRLFDASAPIYVAAQSIAYVTVRDFEAPASFNPLRIKVGGSLQDNGKEDSLFGFSEGCLSMERWDQLNTFFNHTGVKLTFGLNALFRRNESRTEKGVWIGDWEPQNTRDFVKYTISKGYKVDSYEFGNQLCGSGIGARVDANQYGKDVIVLKNLVKELYADPETRPKVLGPGCFYDEKCLNTFLEVLGRGVVDGVTHHIYNLGPGDDPNLMSKILDPLYLIQVSQTYKGVLNVVNKFRPQSGAWVLNQVELLTAGAKMYLDQMGMAATYDQKVFCRQALIGGNYGLLSAMTFIPNPDYYGALLWHRLMGSIVLAVTKESDPDLRVYAHCAKKKSGVSVIFINLSKDRSFNITLSNLKSEDDGKPNYEFVGKQNKEEYHLTSLFGKMKGGTVCLNDVPMVQPGSRDIPAMDPRLFDASAPIYVAAQSIAYVTVRDFEAPACV